MPGMSLDMLQQWRILSGPKPGECYRVLAYRAECWGAHGHAGIRESTSWVLLVLSGPAAEAVLC